nr:hypothetical protein [uncultured Marinobacter sp.]
MKPSMSLTGEHDSHKVAAVFETESDARTMAEALREGTSLADGQVTVLSPSDRHQGQELEEATSLLDARHVKTVQTL